MPIKGVKRFKTQKEWSLFLPTKNDFDLTKFYCHPDLDNEKFFSKNMFYVKTNKALETKRQILPNIRFSCHISTMEEV